MLLFCNKKIAVYLLAAIFFVSIDRFLKILALNHFEGREIKLIGDFLTFNFVKNFNIAFSLPVPEFFLFLMIPLIIIALLSYIVVLFRKGEKHNVGLLTIILFGAISNYVDRIKFGFVIDYLDLKYFTVFNIADSMIVLASVFLLFLNFKKNK